MIGFELERDKGILIVRPSGPLAPDDFRQLAATIDPYIAEKGRLNGLLVDAPSFPGWDSFAGLIEVFTCGGPSSIAAERVVLAPG